MKKNLLLLFGLIYISTYSQGIKLNGPVSAENNQIKNVSDPTDLQDAVTKSYLENSGVNQQELFEDLLEDLERQINDLQSQINDLQSQIGLPQFTFTNNLHSSLPNEWVTEFDEIMDNLKELIPTNSTNYFYKLPIYAWNSIVDKPYQDQIGDATGASISGYGAAINGKWMVLEIPNQEFLNVDYHRYSVIAHEYYHIYQMLLSKNFFDGDIELKWMSEGGAATFESLYIQQYYSFSYFEAAQNNVDVSVLSTPSLFETYSASQQIDINYASSVFIFLALAKELQNLGYSEPQAFRLILKEFWITDPTDQNWKVKFQETFNMSVDDFYVSLQSYTNNIISVIPSSELTLESIYNN
jgi:hypothetical protein